MCAKSAARELSCDNMYSDMKPHKNYVQILKLLTPSGTLRMYSREILSNVSGYCFAELGNICNLRLNGRLCLDFVLCASIQGFRRSRRRYESGI
jgi:hypothetical protein